MIRAVIVDMDGTLLDYNNQISGHTIETIKEYQEKGGIFTINTGRSYTSTMGIIGKTGILCDSICLSGAAVYDKSGKCIQSDAMKDDEIRLVRELEDKYGLYINYLTSEGVVSKSTLDNAKEHYLREAKIRSEKADMVYDEKEALKRYQWILDMVHYETDVDAMIKNGAAVFKMTVMSMEQEILLNAKEEIRSYPNLIAASTFPTSFEINAARVDKGAATLEYIKSYGILPEEVMVIGDSENDIPMFKLPFGKRIAMGNAEDCIKELCTDVSLSNNEDGVAHAIQTWA